MDNKEIVVEELNFGDVKELVNLFADAFKENKFNQIINSKKDTFLHGFFRASLDLFKNDKSAMILGIRDKGKLVCTSLISDAGDYLKIFDTIKFTISLFLWIGIMPSFRLLRFFFYSLSGSSDKNKNFIDFILFGTLADYQKKGYGKKMMDYIYGYAKEKKSSGIVLTCIGETPAYKFYLKEGFKVERSEHLYKATLNFMRKRI